MSTHSLYVSYSYIPVKQKNTWDHKLQDCKITSSSTALPFHVFLKIEWHPTTYYSLLHDIKLHIALYKVDSICTFLNGRSPLPLSFHAAMKISLQIQLFTTALLISKTIQLNKIEHLSKTAYQGYDFIGAQKIRYLVLCYTTLSIPALRFIIKSKHKRNYLVKSSK